MFQRMKVWCVRHYYRLLCYWGWRQHVNKPPGTEVQFPGPAGPIKGRTYPGAKGSDNPLIVYFHGGGWVVGDLATHDAYCHTMRQRTGCSVVAIDYRLAPEHPFPAAMDDCLAVTQWIAENAQQLVVNNGSLIIGGDSAGANLATTTCLELSAAARALVVGSIVTYPVVDHYNAETHSYSERAKGQSLTSNFMVWFWDTYLAGFDPQSSAAQRAMPLRADCLETLPPTFLVTAEFDPLRDEGIAYAEKLCRSGVAVHYRHFATAAHGFACSEGPTDDFNACMDGLVQWLQTLRESNHSGVAHDVDVA